MTDGPHGIRSEKDSIGTNIMRESYPATCFPPAVTSASTWDPDLLEEVGAAIAAEAKALGVTTVLGPGVNIKRSPLCGRNFEYFPKTRTSRAEWARRGCTACRKTASECRSNISAQTTRNISV